MEKNRPTRFVIWFWALAFILVVVGGLALLITAQKEKLASLKAAVAEMKEEHIPLRFMIAARSERGMELKIKLYNMDGSEIAAVEHSMKGESLFLDFVSIPVDGKYLAFPKAVFTEALPPEKGLSLLPLYDRGGFPLIFETKEMSEDLRDDLSALFVQLKSGQSPEDSFGNAVHDIKELKAFETGAVYKVVARLKGGLEIMEDIK